MSEDTIADFLISIKNGYLAKKKGVDIPYSNLKKKLAQILVEEGYLAGVRVKEEKFKTLEVLLKYDNKKPALSHVERVSKLGLRVYKSRRRIPTIMGGLGLVILSTSKGLMTGKEAKKKGLGGEFICQIW